MYGIIQKYKFCRISVGLFIFGIQSLDSVFWCSDVVFLREYKSIENRRFGNEFL